MSAVIKIPTQLSVAEFLAWNPAGDDRWQLVDGEPQAMAPASITHGALQNELGSLLRNHLRATSPHCRVITTPGVIPPVRANHNFRIPDLAVTCAPLTAQESALTDPVLLIEILSPSNQAETWANVWAYATIPSVREILILRTASIRADLLRRQPDGSWPDEPAIIETGNLVLASIGFQIPLSELYTGTRLAPPP